MLLKFSEVFSGVKSLLQVANNLPEGIPATQWDRILQGKSVDLNQILSSMHFVHLNEERKGCLGGAEVVFTIDALTTVYTMQCTQKQHPKPTEGIGATVM